MSEHLSEIAHSLLEKSKAESQTVETEMKQSFSALMTALREHQKRELTALAKSTKEQMQELKNENEKLKNRALKSALLNSFWVVLPLSLMMGASFLLVSQLPEQTRELAELLEKKQALESVEGVTTYKNGASFNESQYKTWTKDGQIYVIRRD